MVAFSVIKTEPFNWSAKDRTIQNINSIKYRLSSLLLVLIGQSKIDEAIDIASYLDDPQLLMYGLTKRLMKFREILTSHQNNVRSN